MTKMIYILPILAVLLSCKSQTECCVYPEGEVDSDVLLGKYQVYEYGYSPGAGYVTEPVPDDPLRYMSFRQDYSFESNYDGFEKFKYFQILEDTTTRQAVLSLYETPSFDNPSNSNYTILSDSGIVKLQYRFCIEGCHIGLRKLDYRN